MDCSSEEKGKMPGSSSRLSRTKIAYFQIIKMGFPLKNPNLIKPIPVLSAVCVGAVDAPGVLPLRQLPALRAVVPGAVPLS